MLYWIGLTLTGLLTGIFAGLVGAGAEIIVVPLLSLFGLLGSLKHRIGTSLFMLLPPIGYFAAMEFYRGGYVDVYAGLYLALVFTIFASVSSRFTLKLNPEYLKKIFSIFTIISGIYIYFQ